MQEAPSTSDAGLLERELVRRTLAGDREAFRLVVLQHQGFLAEVVFRATGDRAGTEDLVQETFLRAFRSLDRYDPRWRLSTWLARIAMNVARDQGRRAKVRVDALPALAAREPSAPRGPVESAEQAEAAAHVGAALEQLPEPQREVVALSVWGGLSQREIADALDVPLGTIKTRHRTALMRLRDLVAGVRNFQGGGSA